MATFVDGDITEGRDEDVEEAIRPNGRDTELAGDVRFGVRGELGVIFTPDVSPVATFLVEPTMRSAEADALGKRGQP